MTNPPNLESGTWDPNEYQGDYFQHDYNDSASDRDYAALALDENRMHHGHEAPWEEDTIEEGTVDRMKERKVQRNMAILRTNRQIYIEVTSVLHAGLRLVLQPGDVLCLNTGKDIVRASESVWRHNPLLDIGTTSIDGQTVYATPELDGVMEPHVLARFTKITFYMAFQWATGYLEARETYDTERDQTTLIAPGLFVNDDLTVNPEDEAKLLAFYKRSTIIHQLVKILSNSPKIVSLEMDLFMSIHTDYDMDSDSDMSTDMSSDLEDEPSETAKKFYSAGVRAVDLFVDSGLLAPLEKLSNVQSFKFDITPQDIDRNGYQYTSSPKQAKMLRALKQTIERNYVVKQV